MAGYYFYRCRQCLSVITRLQFDKAMVKGPKICPCGSGSASPTNPIGMEWLKPSVLKMSLLQILGKLEPAPEPNEPITVTAGTPVPGLSLNERALGRDEEDSL